MWWSKLRWISCSGISAASFWKSSLPCLLCSASDGVMSPLKASRRLVLWKLLNCQLSRKRLQILQSVNNYFLITLITYTSSDESPAQHFFSGWCRFNNPFKDSMKKRCLMVPIWAITAAKLPQTGSDRSGSSSGGKLHLAHFCLQWLFWKNLALFIRISLMFKGERLGFSSPLWGYMSSDTQRTNQAPKL